MTTAPRYPLIGGEVAHVKGVWLTRDQVDRLSRSVAVIRGGGAA